MPTTYLTLSDREPCWLVVTDYDDDITSRPLAAAVADEAAALAEVRSEDPAAEWRWESTPTGGFWSSPRGDHGRYVRQER